VEKLIVSSLKVYYRCIFGRGNPVKFWKSSTSRVQTVDPDWMCLGRGSALSECLCFIIL